jgi:HEXXH motif-containing protein
MRERLAESLRYVVERARGHLPVPESALDGLLARVGRGPVSPQVFGAYCDLVLAIDDAALDEAAALLDELVSIPDPGTALRVLELADPARDAAARRYARFMDTDPNLPIEILPPPRASAQACRRLVGTALDQLERGHAELAAEIRALLREIVLAAGNGEPGATTFDGASSFMLWGGIVLNVAEHATSIQMVQALAHESGHNLLFGLAADGPLVDDDDTRLHPSPLRADPRPLDGIYHATFVCARIHEALARLLASGILDGGARAEAERALETHARLFAQGLDTLDAHARLTPLGAAVMKGARAYMEEARRGFPARDS